VYNKLFHYNKKIFFSDHSAEYVNHCHTSLQEIIKNLCKSDPIDTGVLTFDLPKCRAQLQTGV